MVKSPSSTVPAEFHITLLDLLILYTNSLSYEGEWLDVDKPRNQFLAECTTRIVKVTRQDLESMLYSCVANSENGKFWHPDKRTVKHFVGQIIGNQERKDFYYDTYYNFFTKLSSNKATNQIGDPQLCLNLSEGESS